MLRCCGGKKDSEAVALVATMFVFRKGMNTSSEHSMDMSRGSVKTGGSGSTG